MSDIKLPVFQSMQQCASVTGIPLALIRKAIAMGCPAAVQKRFDSAIFIRWLFGNIEEFKAMALSPRERLAEAEAQLAEEKVKTIRETERQAAEALAMQIITEKLSPIAAKLEILPATVGPKCNPTDPTLARQELEIAIKEIMVRQP